MKIKKLWFLFLMCICIIITQTGCSREEPVTDTEFYLDTFCTITIQGAGEEKAEAAIEAAFDCCKKYDNLLSQTKPGSDIYHINESEGKAVKVSEETYRLIEAAIHYAEISDGMFDFTIGAVTALWDFKQQEQPQLPKQRALQAALKTVGYQNVHLMSGERIQLKNPGTQLNLGGMAKGYIADRVIEVLRQQGIESAVVNLGGNVAVLGGNVDGEPWKIGIERPYSDRTEILGSVEAADCNLVTSGIYERKFEKDGKLYHHILNPETGYPMETELDQVTVTGPTGRGMDCDAYSTICMMLGLEKGMELINHTEGLEAVFVSKDGTVETTEGVTLKEKDKE